MADPSTDDILNQLVRQLLAKQGSNPLTDVSTVLGNAAQGRAMGVSAENATRLGAGDLSNRLFQSALDRYKAQAAMPNFRADQAVKGDQIANTQDVVPMGPPNVMSHVVNFTGGKRPSNLGQNARSAGAALSSIGASNIGKDILPAVPTMPKMADGGVLGNLLGGGSLATSLLGALSKGGGSSGGGLLNGLKKLFGGGGSGGGGSTGGGLDLTDPNTFVGPMDPNTFVGPENGNTDPSQFPGYTDPMQEYQDWLAHQQGGGSQDDWSNP